MTSMPGITITQVGDYVFTVDFGKGLPALQVDEAEPVGGGTGPFPEQMLVAAVANCLCASLVFALGKFKQDGHGVAAEASCRVERGEAGRLRVLGIDVRIRLGSALADLPRIDRVLDQFERFCTVSESVKRGIPVAVSVLDGDGVRLK